jgi:hypothetical protein
MDELTQHTFAYLFRDSRILFGGFNTGGVRLVFERESIVDWSKTDPADTEFIDNYPVTHLLIVFYALEKYAIRDGDMMKAVQQNIDREEKKIVQWAMRTWPRQRRVTRVRRFL